MSRRSAFTLLELLIVIVILGTVSAIGYVGYTKYVVRAQISEAFRVLEEYKVTAAALRARSGTIKPYYVLFTDANTTGFVSGTPNGTSAVKQVGLKYVDTITADSGTAGSNTYILLGAGLNNTNRILAGADHVYIAGVQTPGGLFTWTCGASASKGDTIPSDYLPEACQDTLP
jgi:prepilin-type N-terminal cleavage/methylation domain-containing protein